MRRARRRPVVALGVVAAVAVPGGVLAASASASRGPALTLVAASKAIKVTHYQGEPLYGLDLGFNVVIGERALVVTAERSTYREPVTARLTLGTGRSATTRTLPTGRADLTGMRTFVHVTYTSAAGTVVAQADQDWCPSGSGGGFFYGEGAARARPNAPGTSPWPGACFASSPFTLGNVYGLQAGWASSLARFDGAPVTLADGTYRVTATISPAWQSLLDLPGSAAVASTSVTVSTVAPPPKGGAGLASAATSTGTVVARAQAASSVHEQVRATVESSGSARERELGDREGPRGVPARQRPDLRALPAFDVSVLESNDLPQDPNLPIPPPNHDYLSFSATVWNAGRSPLVVEGFRTPGADQMQAYQYFYDRAGKQLGWTEVGSMQYDPRPGHEHWHFLDFAQYNLLDANQKQAVRSQKEAFCLAPTDAVDLTLPAANWSPGSIGLYSQCGGPQALAIRENLDVGWGDTYGQYLPGQSFDVTNLPNGSYYIEVLANPAKRLYELDTTNNRSLRQVIIGGKPGARTVTVPPYDGLDAP